jgi:hypothetical protein
MMFTSPSSPVIDHIRMDAPWWSFLETSCRSNFFKEDFKLQKFGGCHPRPKSFTGSGRRSTGKMQIIFRQGVMAKVQQGDGGGGTLDLLSFLATRGIAIPPSFLDTSSDDMRVH